MAKTSRTATFKESLQRENSNVQDRGRSDREEKFSTNISFTFYLTPNNMILNPRNNIELLAPVLLLDRAVNTT